MNDYISLVHSTFRDRLLYTTLLLANFSVLIMGIFSFQNQSPVILGQYFYGVFFVVIFDFISVLYIIELKLDNSQYHTPSLRYNWRVFIIILLFDISVLSVFGLSVTFYLISAILLIILLERALSSVASVESTLTLLLITAIIFLLSLLRINGFPVAVNDTLVKGSNIAAVAAGGDASFLKYTRYGPLPMYFILSAISTKIFDLSVRYAVFLQGAVIYTGVLIVFYCLVKYATKSKLFALISAIFLFSNPLFLRFSNRVHPQSLSFVLLCSVLLLLLKYRPQPRDHILFLTVTFVWIGTHHLGLIVAMPFVIIILLWNSGNWGKHNRSLSTNVDLRLIVFGLLLSTHWVLISRVFMVPIRWYFYVSPGSSGAKIIPTITTSKLISNSIPFFLQNIEYSILLAITLFGVIFLYKREIQIANRHLLLSCLLLAGILYFPNPLWLPLLKRIPLRRSGLMVLPFVVPIAAISVHYLYQSYHPRLGRPILKFILAFLLFTSLLSGWTEPSVNDIAGYDKEARNYISSYDLHTISFIRIHKDTEIDTYAPWLIHMYLNLNIGQIDNIEDREGRYWYESNAQLVYGDKRGGNIIVEKGLTIYPESAFKRDSVKIGLHSGGHVDMSDEEMAWDTRSNSVVYSNGYSKIIYE